MNPHFEPHTWTVYPDYGGAPIVWTSPGLADGPRLGELLLHASDMESIVPAPLGAQFDDWGCAWESMEPQQIDWLFFHQEGLRMSALLALWVAQFNIYVRYVPPYEDGRFSAHDNEVFMTPGHVARLAKGLPSLEEDRESWEALFALYGLDAPPAKTPTPG